MVADTEQIARQALAEIFGRFSHLTYEESETDPVEISINVPAQPGLRHELWLALQNNDELTFSVGRFQVEWFPCTDPERAEEFIESVCNFIAGKYRVLEHYRGQRCIKAQLQRPVDGGWKTVATWSMLALPFGKKTTQVLTNSPVLESES